MRHIQKLIAMVGVSAMVFTLAACSSSDDTTADTNAADSGNAADSDADSASDGLPQGDPSTPLGLTKVDSTDGTTINVLMVNNPQMLDLQNATESQFTAKTGIKVNYTVLDENSARNKASMDFKNQAGQYDIATLSNFEVPIYAKNDWLVNLSPYIAQDPGFDQDDILPAMSASLSDDGDVYGQPFYGESSFLMYRKDVFDDAGLTVPNNPTWDEVAELAAQVDGAEPGMKGICLRGLPGWGQLGAPLTTVVNTFGGVWFDNDWNAQLTEPGFTEATEFYVKLVKEHGEASASTAGYTECLSALQQGKVAMWYDSTAAAGPLEAADSPVAGKLAYAQAPVKDTDASGWLYTWAFLMEKATKNADAAWQFISWASSKEYQQYIGETKGWPSVPNATRQSLYDNADYMAESAVFAAPTLEAIQNADPLNPGTTPRNIPGIQFMDIPEFTAFGDKVTAEISAAIAGQQSVADALKKGQGIVQSAINVYK